MSQRRLLLADDSVTIQKVVNLTFADEGIEVVTVGDGDAAIEQLSVFQPDLVMADVNMPGKTGYEVCEYIKSDPASRHIPVILLVGSFEPFDEAEARRVGADDYMTKPFQSIRQLVNKVSELFGTAETVETPIESVSQAYEPETEPEPEPLVFEPAPAYFEPASEPVEEQIETGAQTLEMEPVAPVDFGDAGMDDEMIEASTVGDFGIQETEDIHATQPLTRDEVHDFEFVSRESSIYGRSESFEPSPIREETLTETSESISEPAAALEPETIAEEMAPEEPEAAETAPEPAGIPVPVAVPVAPYFMAEREAPVNIDESNPLDLPPSLVEETGIRAPFESLDIDHPIVPPVPAPAAPVMSEDMIAEITARVADKLAERIARVLDSEVVRDVTLDVLKEIDQTKDLS